MSNEHENINPEKKQILIVGGGTSGWLSAAFLKKTLAESYLGEVDITLVESSDIPTIGVGEATTPSLQHTLSTIGVNEFDFMNNCDATFKHGIRFNGWKHDPKTAPGDYYFHPFQSGTRVGIDHAARHWANTPPHQRKAFAESVSIQKNLAERNYSPKTTQSKNFGGPIPYAYHLDAGKLAEFLKTKAKADGVIHKLDTVTDIDVDQDNVIQTINFKSGMQLSPDLIIDCTGFSARMINHDKSNQFVDKNHELFCNRAVATRVPITPEKIVPYTKSTAQKSGWIWDINLRERRGVGHVYSAAYCSDDDAKKTLADYLALNADDIECRELKMRIGYHREQWRGNCVAVGLSAGFLEPLESTGIYLVEMAAWMLAQFIPRFLEGAKVAERFNVMMSRHFENIVDFIKAHYCLSQRRDSKFWQDNTDPATVSESLQALLDLWDDDFPGDYDFDSHIVCFNSENYQYILYGMTDPKPYQSTPAQSQEHSASFMKLLEQRHQAQLERLRANLVSHPRMLEKIGDFDADGAEKAATNQPFTANLSSNYKVR